MPLFISGFLGLTVHQSEQRLQRYSPLDLSCHLDNLQRSLPHRVASITRSPSYSASNGRNVRYPARLNTMFWLEFLGTAVPTSVEAVHRYNKSSGKIALAPASAREGTFCCIRDHSLGRRPSHSVAVSPHLL